MAIPPQVFTAEYLYCQDEYYLEFEDMVEALADDGLEQEDFPVAFQACKREYGHVADLKSVVEGLVEDFFWRRDKANKESGWWWHNLTNAETIGEHFMEDLYDGCEEHSIPDTPIKGVEDLQWAIDAFTTLNTPIWRVFAQYRWFNPVRWAIAPNILQGALERFEALNRPNHYVFTPTGKPLLLHWDDVKDIYAELFDEAA